eukprot:IDg23852t1
MFGFSTIPLVLGFQHWMAAKRVLRYVKGTRNLSITYGTKSSLEPLGYYDSDWGGCVETRKSTEGFLFLIAGGAEAIWLSRLLAEMLGKLTPTPITVMVDNEGAIDSLFK